MVEPRVTVNLKSGAQNEGQSASALKPQASEPYAAAELEAAAAVIASWELKPGEHWKRHPGWQRDYQERAAAVLDAVLPQYAARVREEAAKTLRACAAGRREYIRNAPDHAAVDLEHEATLLDDAARVAEGDIGPLYGWLPSWRWTPEMHAALDRTHATAPTAEEEPDDH